ncbi:MAG: SDR family NAD(P)-dependent oxidoreductase [bacterium]|jgi:3-oxoacyl-[acyl-carrier protein] reductase|nr:SDR family oxidoreductase [Candidatus Neomarinimicrobiota bacterium]HIL86057.1 SDR family oxidoreductase [Candidatus Neomarinimicrobiota bacterium]
MGNKLEGKVALITGSGRGIGRELALMLAKDGAHIVVNDLDADPANQTVADIIAMGGKAVVCVGSVTADDFADKFINTALDTFGGLDIIVNNAGYTWDNVIQKMGDDQWQAILDCHLTAPFRILRAAQPHIKRLFLEEKEKGITNYRKVVNISSTSGMNGNAGQVNYATAKAGVVGMAKTMAKEWGRYNVNVNAVGFGLIKTRLTDADAEKEESLINIEGNKIKVGVNSAVFQSAKTMIPLGRPGTPQEAAGAIYMFCIPESNYVTGQILMCHGGGFGL